MVNLWIVVGYLVICPVVPQDGEVGDAEGRSVGAWSQVAMGPVTAATWTRDGRPILATQEGVADGEEFTTAAGVLALSPDGAAGWAATCEDGSLLRVRPGEPPRRVPISDDWLPCVAAAEDGSLIVGGVDGTLVRVDQDDGITARVGWDHGCSAIVAAESKVFVGADDGALGRFTLDHLAFEQTVPRHAGSIRALASGRAGTLASGAQDHTVVISWESGSRRGPAVGTGHASWVVDVTKTDEGYASLSSAGWVRWHGVDGSLQHERFVGDSAIALAWRQEALRVAWSSGHAGWVSRLPVGPFAGGHRGPVYGAAVAPDGSGLASGGTDHSVFVWDVGTSRPRWQGRGHGRTVTDVVWSPDGAWVISADAAGHVRRWEASTGRLDAGRFLHGAAVNALAVSPDGEWLAVAGRDHTITLWNPRAGRAQGRLQAHDNDVKDVAFSADSTRLASAGDDGLVRVWRLADRGLEAEHARHDGPVHAVVWKDDAVWSGGLDQRLVRWSASGNGLIVDGFELGINRLAAVGDLVWAACSDGRIHLWDGTERRALEGRHTLAASWVGADVNGTLFSASFDGSLAMRSSDGRWARWYGGPSFTAAHVAVCQAATEEQGTGEVPFAATAHRDGAVVFWRLDDLVPIAWVAATAPVIAMTPNDGEVTLFFEGGRVVACGLDRPPRDVVPELAEPPSSLHRPDDPGPAWPLGGPATASAGSDARRVVVDASGLVHLCVHGEVVVTTQWLGPDGWGRLDHVTGSTSRGAQPPRLH